jgi:peptidoglycan-associated lipoprotein
LNFVYDLLIEYPGMVLRLMSHTDARGTTSSNQELSERRAKSCIDYLVKEKGIDPRRLIPRGDGENVPRVLRDPVSGELITLTEAYIDQFKTSDKTRFEMLHQLNRRTEAEVVRMDFTP